jgi:hypothetical protein
VAISIVCDPSYRLRHWRRVSLACRRLPVSSEMKGNYDPRSSSEEIPMAAPGMLRGRLLMMQEDALYRIARYGIEPGRLALVADITAALDALGHGPIEWELVDRPAQLALGEASIDAEPVSRAVISDDGETIWLMLFREDSKAAAVELSPAAALALASRLLAAASPRLS